MKKSVKIMSLILAVLTIVSSFSVVSFAEESAVAEKKEISIVNYNVAGLPDFNVLLGKEGRNVKENQKIIGGIISDRNYDIVAVQEDFGYHKTLKENMVGFDYVTEHTGMIPGGDGMNIYSKYPIYNEQRHTWEKAFGVISDGADEMTAKGILYAVIELEDGVLVDFYDIHADAYDGYGSKAAREDNFRQLATLIIANDLKNDRPDIVVGDFNTYSSFPDDVNSNMNYYLHDVCKLKDAWTEIHNEGNYEDFSQWFATGAGRWGNWDSVEKVLYKNGGGVEIEATSYFYEWLKDSEGNDLSDHAAAISTLTYTKTEDFVENTEELKVVKRGPVKNFFNIVKYIFIDLKKIIENFDQLVAFFQG